MIRLGLIGHPAKHSKSPLIHETFFKKVNLNGNYDVFEIKQEHLKQTINYFLQNNFVGFNVTVPFKEDILLYLDELDQSAKNLKAVNTVKIENGKLKGYNTDGQGYWQSLKERYPSFVDSIERKRVLIIGAGGAAKGIYYTLQMFPIKQLDVANRTNERAKNIIKGYFNSNVLSLEEASTHLNQYDLIIQTTSVGMEPYENEQIISLKNMKPNTIVSDIIYKPKWTSFLKEARKLNGKLLFGEDMLWYQAKEAFEIWTGKEVNDIDLLIKNDKGEC